MSNTKSIYEFDSYRVDVANRLLLLNDQPVSVTPKAVEILIVLIANRGQIMSKTDLMSVVWPETVVEEGNLSQNIYLLRKRLNGPANGRPYVETIARRGYRFNGDVREITLGNGKALPDGSAFSGRALQDPITTVTPATGTEVKVEKSSPGQSHLLTHYLLLSISVLSLTVVAVLLVNNFRTTASKAHGATGPASESERAYAKGRQFWKKQSTPALEESLQYFNESIRLNGNYAPAYAGLADAYVALSERYDMDRHDGEALAKASQAAERALQLNPNLAEGHVALAIFRQTQWDWTAAEREFKRALELDRDCAYAHQHYSLLLAALGRQAESKTEMRRAQDLEPESISISEDLGKILLFSGDYQAAISQFNGALAIDPSAPLAISIHRWLGLAYEEKGMHEQAVAEFIESLRLQNGSPERISTLRQAYDGGGIKGYWLKWLEYRDERIKLRGINPFKVAQIYALVGNLNGAFEELEKARADHSLPVADLRFGPLLQNLRSDRRYAELLRLINIDHS
jgi:DNA-binding winged helix-turn-helix (wHTH) protein/tetratricopeptide (TPR) repeat protein